MDLYENDHGEYRSKVSDAMKPFEIDSGSFETPPELLEKTDALDPDLVENDKRLSDRALARIVLDITSALIDDKRIKDLAAKIRKQLEKDEYEMPLVPEFNPKEAKTKGFSPFLRPDGTPTVAGPVTAIDDDDPKYRKTPDEEEAEQLADAEAEAAAKEASSAESLSEGELVADQDEEDDEE
ncbi:hypothetical protein PR003_g22350 [Phytophthora rubi]|uniref:Uncharacterized protein n=1 Tax=Phytophthora rubi TaxID=129364 RepID=A0A6A3JCK6_9STRA|nr:hypothetical protein PR001_g21806 [Phytophthora rubi]KAE9302124.1 hypothetical protein PR003_g22350 [Phytophthora rubi]